MSRVGILALSVVCCGFGLLSLQGPSSLRGEAYAVNVALAVLLFFLAGHDLRARGWRLGYLFAGAYVLPLVGLVVYFALSTRPLRDADPLAEVRALLREAFDDFSDDDWEHCLGGVHVLLRDRAGLVGHAALVPRRLVAGGRELRAGYVEGVAVRRDARGRGHGRALMAAVEADRSYDLLALSTTQQALPFYLARGWLVWRGPTSVRTPDGVVRTPDDDGGVLVRPRAVELDLDAALTCEWRPGDVW